MVAAKVKDLKVAAPGFASKFIRNDNSIFVDLTVTVQLHFTRRDARHSGFSDPYPTASALWSKDNHLERVDRRFGEIRHP
jgi:hypothetical protein